MDKEKFWYETLRAAVFGILSFIGVYIIAATFSNHQRYQTYIDQERIRLREQLIDEYLNVSYEYTSLLYDVLNKSDVRRAFEMDIQYDKYKNVLNRMTVYFGPVVDGKVDEINREFIPLLNPRNPAREWKTLREQLKGKNREMGELALEEIHMDLRVEP